MVISTLILLHTIKCLFFFSEPTISAQITLASLLEGYSITCNVNGAEDLKQSISYQWTKNNGTQIQMQVESDPRVPSLLLFRLSDVGLYTCQATISSPYLLDNITIMATQHVTIQSELIIITRDVIYTMYIALHDNNLFPFNSSISHFCDCIK